MDKIADAHRICEEALSKSANPVVYFSGGKDSVVMLHLMRFQFGYDLPIVLHREPWLTHKYAFAERVIRAWNLVVYDYPPMKVNLWHGKGVIAFTNHYQVGEKDGVPVILALPKNIVETNQGLCGLDILSRPTGGFNYPWDMMFAGHKDCDEDQIAGKIPVTSDIVINESGPSIAFPLRHWSHDDVWDYTDQYSLPVQQDRYNRSTRSELPDKTFNSDYFEACIKCIDRRTSGDVICPKTGHRIPNIGDKVQYEAPIPSYIKAA